MPIPSLYVSGGSARAWSVARAAAYGAGVGALAALIKAFGPMREPASAAAHAVEVAGAALAFAILFFAAAALRNFIARRLIWPDMIKRGPD